MQSRGVRRPSVCPSVCKHFANRFFSQANGWIATKLAHDGPQTGLHPGCAQGQAFKRHSSHGETVCQTVCYTVRSQTLTFCLYMRSLYEAPLHSPSSISIRQLDLMSKSWNELLRHGVIDGLVRLFSCNRCYALLILQFNHYVMGILSLH